jgi:DNA-directed RNA polymerase subunit L
MSKISDLKEENGQLTFTLFNTDVSYANAIRRTIISSIPIIGFKTTPYEENNATITANTSRLNNEIIKHRLSCIPVHLNYLDENIPFEDYLLELDVENNTDTIIMVTTHDFKILNTKTNTYLEASQMKQIFPPFIPPDGNGEYYIDFIRLRPKLSDEIPGEKIKLTCKFSVVTAGEDSAFNVTGTCAYGFTPHREEMERQLEIRKQVWKDKGKSEDEVKFEAANWKLLEGMRYTIKNSFDFIIESVGIYSNERIIIEACNILEGKLLALIQLTKNKEIDIHRSENTLDNCYDIILPNEDYTIGNMLNYELYAMFYRDFKQIDYVGFKKLHPHDTDSILRLSLVDKTKSITTAKTMFISSIREAIKKTQEIKGCFDGSRVA